MAPPGSDPKREEIRRHFDGLADSYDRIKQRRSGYHEILIGLYREILGDSTDLRVLEIGCGTGAILGALAPRRGLGVDLSEGMIRVARERWASRGLEFRVGEAEKLELSERFDWVLLPDVIEHLHAPEEGLRRGAAHLAPGGRFLVTWANHRWTPILHLLELARLKMPEGPHRWLRPDEVDQVLLRAGLQPVLRETRALLPVGGRWARGINRWARRLPLLRRIGLIRVHLYRDQSAR